jgi:hypothetical protein
MAEETPPAVTALQPKFWQGLRDFLGKSRELCFAWETLKRLFAFTVVALAAFGLDNIVEILKRHHAPTFITYILTGVEVLALIADVVWFLAGLLGQIEVSLKEILKSRIALVLGCMVLFLVGVILSPYLKTWCLELLNAIRQHLT